MENRHAIIVDIGKTVSKVSLWDRAGRRLDRVTYANDRSPSQGRAALDFAGIARWLTEALARYANHDVEAIIPIGHGAAFAALRDDALAVPPIDYDHEIPGNIVSSYRAQRDGFDLTGSPDLGGALNLGCQLHWLDMSEPGTLDGATLLPWAQYWAWFLCGTARSEVTTLGCHSDLWAPARHDFSPMAHRRGWADQFAPMARAGDVIGTLRPELAHQTGLSPDVRIHCGLHDSNAALLAARGFEALTGGEATVLSTGTWFIAMRAGASQHGLAMLDEKRDCLINVDVEGALVPSSRYMGGREIEMLGGGLELPGLDGLETLVASGNMILPSLVQGCGPFPDHMGKWAGPIPSRAERRAACALYAALMTQTSLGLIGAAERILIEGRFAASELFTRLLATLHPQAQLLVCDDGLDASFGALRLIWDDVRAETALRTVVPLPIDLADYRARWIDVAMVAA